MEPIYLPTHKMDLDKLAASSFRRAIPHYFILFMGVGLALGMALQRYFRWPAFSEFPFALSLAILLLPVIRFRTKDMYRAKGRLQFRVPRTMTLDDKEFRIEYKNGVSTTIPWSAITGKKWTKDFLVLESILGAPIPLQRSVLTPEAIAVVEAATDPSRPKLGWPDAW